VGLLKFYGCTPDVLEDTSGTVAQVLATFWAGKYTNQSSMFSKRHQPRPSHFTVNTESWNYDEMGNFISTNSTVFHHFSD
jgi:hypothetical protein